MSPLKGCFVMFAMALLLMGGGFCLLTSGEKEYVSASPVDFMSLPEEFREMIPNCAENIYTAQFADWQVGEWCFRFDITYDKVETLKAWCENTVKGRDVIEAPKRYPYHMTAPNWWHIPEEADLICSVAGDLEHPVSMCVWYLPAQNRVWMMYYR